MNTEQSLKSNARRVAFLISHPTQYHAPIFRELAKNREIDLTVYYCFRGGLVSHFDAGFGKIYQWDIPLLDGYQSIFLNSFFPGGSVNSWWQLHFGIISAIIFGKFDACIVHGYTTLTQWLAFATCIITRTPLILKGEADLEKKIALWKKALKRIILTALFRASTAFLYSYTFNKAFFKRYGARDAQLFFAPCAVDNAFFQSKRDALLQKRKNIRKEFGIVDESVPLFVFSGKFITRKRVCDIVESAIRMNKQGILFALVLVGDGPERDSLNAIVERNKAKNIFFVGFKNQSEISRFYIAGDIFVLSSAYDPSPKSINEAMNFGLAIIASDGVKTAPDLVVAERCGFMYPAGDVIQLTECMKRLASNIVLRMECSRQALKAIERWSPTENVQGIIDAVRYVAF